jgi:1-acyl-sn-glycerol-3-phosphate acyltransferase
MNWIWTVGAPFVHLIVSVVFRLRVEGVGNVPLTGPAVLAPNHLSVLDGPVVSVVTGARRGRATRNLIAAEVFHGVVGWVLRQARQVPIRRGAGDTGALAAAVDAARSGSCVGIFPEGRVTNDPAHGLQRVRSGLMRIAMPARAPVVPVGIWGTQAVWPREGLIRSALLRRRGLALVYGEPVMPRPGESPSDFGARYRAALETAVLRARILVGDQP